MQSIDEVIANVSRFKGIKTSEALRSRLSKQRRQLHIDDWCTQCFKCVKKCSHGALMSSASGLIVNHDKCVLCGYCSSVCEEFCIKVV